jgi:hypothetical protein
MLHPWNEFLTDLELLHRKLNYYTAILWWHFTIIEEFIRVDMAVICKFTLNSLAYTTKHYDGKAKSHLDS